MYAARKTKKSQGLPEHPDPVYAEVQPGTTNAHLEMKMNVAYCPTEHAIAVGKLETQGN